MTLSPGKMKGIDEHYYESENIKPLNQHETI